MFHFENYALTMTLLPRKFPKYSIYSYQELTEKNTIDRIGWITMKESLNNFDFNLVNNELSTTAISLRDEFHAVEKLGQSRK